MKAIRVLDCTLRDGGYVNNWNFGYETINGIVAHLCHAKVDIIECGFLSQTKETNNDKSIYRTLTELDARFSNCEDVQMACMVNYGEYCIEDLLNYSEHSIVNTIRVAFHLKDLKNALTFCTSIINKGYKVFIQPMVTQSYSQCDLDYLIEQTNQMQATALYIVDSFGTMRQDEAVRLFKYYDTKLNPNIQIGFHSHNNLQLSFSCAQDLIKVNENRVLVLDSSVFGMGRGAGNLCTELLTMHLNEIFNTHYDLVPILEIIDNWLSPIFNASPWGYSVPYYLASINNCHPNYATWLVNKSTLGVKAINDIISQLPNEYRKTYNPSIIESLYKSYQEHNVDDSATLQKIQGYIADRIVLLLAPGRSLKENMEDIHRYILTNNVCIIAVNFEPNDLCADILFVSNLKRFKGLNELHTQKRIITSNIPYSDKDKGWRVNYSSLIDTNYDEIDNAGMMALRLLHILGVKHVAMAGFDGYTFNQHQNYISEKMILNTSAEVIIQRNLSISQQLQSLRKNIDIEFITPSIYNKK